MTPYQGRTLKELTVMYEVAAASAAAADPDELLERVCDVIARHLYPDHFGVLLLDENAGVLRPHPSYRGLAPDAPQAVPLGEGIASLALSTGQPIVVPDVRREPRYIVATPGMRSEVAVPLRTTERKLGVLNVESPRLNAFGDEDVQLLRALADQIAAALSRAQLHRDLQRLNTALEARVIARSGELQALFELSHRFIPVITYDQLARALLDALNQALGPDVAACLLLIADRYRQLIIHKRLPLSPEAVAAVETRMRAHFVALGGDIPEEDGLSLVLEEGRNYDAQARPLTMEPSSEEYAPLFSDSEILGLLGIFATRPRAFSPQQLAFLQAIAREAMITLARIREIEAHTAQLREERERLEAVLATVPDGILVLNREGEIILGNPVARRWLGGRLKGVDPAALQGAIQEIAHRRERERLLEFGPVTLQAHAAPMDGDVVITLHDVSQLAELDRLKSQFVSHVSHELRTPITNIKLYQTLLRKGKPEKQGEYWRILDRETARLQQLVEDLLDLSRLDLRGAEMIHREPLDLVDLTAQVVDQYRGLAEDRGVSLAFRPALPEAPLEADANALTQVLVNLITNAIHYTPAGGRVTVSVGRREAAGRRALVLQVRDTGYGILPEERDQIFSRFYRGYAARKSRAPGTGLGLSIVQEIVRLHGGHLEVSSRVGDGSTFCVVLPASVPPAGLA